MKQFYADPQDIETSGNDSSDRLAELANQCSRLANLPTPASATDRSFGTSY
jgi:hypothetical protein